MEIDRLLLSPACYYTSFSLTAWLCVKMYTSVEHDFCTTCYERPPVLRAHFCLAEGVVVQNRFYCIVILKAQYKYPYYYYYYYYNTNCNYASESPPGVYEKDHQEV